MLTTFICMGCESLINGNILSSLSVGINKKTFYSKSEDICSSFLLTAQSTGILKNDKITI